MAKLLYIYISCCKSFQEIFLNLAITEKNQLLIDLTEAFESPCSPYSCSFKEPTALIFFWLILRGFCVFQVNKNIPMENFHLKKKEKKRSMKRSFPFELCVMISMLSWIRVNFAFILHIKIYFRKCAIL